MSEEFNLEDLDKIRDRVLNSKIGTVKHYVIDDYQVSLILKTINECRELETQVTNLKQACTLSKAAVEAMQSANNKLSGELERLQKENETMNLLLSNIVLAQFDSSSNLANLNGTVSNARAYLESKTNTQGLEKEISEVIEDNFMDLLDETNTQGGENESCN